MSQGMHGPDQLERGQISPENRPIKALASGRHPDGSDARDVQSKRFPLCFARILRNSFFGTHFALDRSMTFRSTELALVVLVAVVAGCSASSSPEDNAPGSGAARGSGGAGTGGVGTGGVGIGGNGSGGAGNNGSTCTQAVDVVFVMDVSTSMGPFLQKLAQEMPAVDASAKALNLATEPHYGLVVFVDDTEVVNAGTPYQDIATLQADFESWASFTSQGTQIDSGIESSSMPENSLDALYRAATEFAWRPADQTLRVVIHTTDDSFWNGPTITPEGVPTTHGYGDTLNALQTANVRVFSFASKLGGEDETDDVSPGWFASYLGMPAVPDATGGSVFELDQVLANQISLAASITTSIESSHCQPYPSPK
jgi:hypothetical protein